MSQLMPTADLQDTNTKFYLLLELCDGGNMEAACIRNSQDACMSSCWALDLRQDAARSLDGGLSEVRCAAFIKQLLPGAWKACAW